MNCQKLRLVFKLVQEQPGIRSSEIANATKIEKKQVHKFLLALKKSGLIARSEKFFDRECLWWENTKYGFIQVLRRVRREAKEREEMALYLKKVFEHKKQEISDSAQDETDDDRKNVTEDDLYWTEYWRQPKHIRATMRPPL